MLTENSSLLKEHGPISFWFLNHDLDDDELRWQMNQMKEQGFRGVMIHPRDGLEIAYLSEGWFAKVKLIVDYCRDIDLQAWLYDEDPFPSGDAGGRIIMEHPELRPRVLHMHRMNTMGGKVRFDFEAGRLLRVLAYLRDSSSLGYDSEAPLDLTAYAGTVRKQWQPSLVQFNSYYAPYEDYGGGHWRTTAEKPSYRVDYVLPEGDWMIVAFVDRAVEFYVDVLNPQTTKLFMQKTHQQYLDRFESQFGGIIPGMFTDEPQLMGHHPWTGGFPAYFQSLHGYDILEVLPHLFLTMNERTAQIRRDYRSALSRLFIDVYISPIAGWCKKHGIASIGHISPEEDPIGQTYKAPYLLSILKRFDIPGTDLITDLMGSNQFPLLHIGPKLASSAAHLQGKTIAVAEAYGANSWSLTLADMTRKADWLMVLGINELITHGQYYSIDGKRKHEAPPSLFYPSGLWSFYRSWSNYVAERSGKLKEGTHVCSILLYYPQSSFDAWLPDQFNRAERFREYLGKLVHILLSNQWDFDWVDEESLLEMQIEDNQWTSGTERYSLLLLPESELIGESLKAYCREAGDRGALVWHVGTAVAKESDVAEVPLPQLLDLLDETLSRNYLLREKDNKPVREVYMLERKIGDIHRLFIVNARDQWRELNASLNGVSGYGCIHLPPQGSILLDWNPGNGAVERNEEEADILALGYLLNQGGQTVDELELTNDWSYSAEEDNVFSLTQFFAWQTDSTDPINGITFQTPLDVQRESHCFEGPVRLFSRFFTSGSLSPLKLVSERSAWNGECEVYVNGKRVTEFSPTRKFDIFNVEADISPFIEDEQEDRVSLNWLELRFPKGGSLLEPLRLYGQFLVQFPNKDRGIGLLVLEAPHAMKTLGRGKGFHELGYPHYTGLVSYVKEIELPDEWFEQEIARGRVYLYSECVKDAATLLINNHRMSDIVKDPFIWDISRLIHRGVNRVEIRVGNHPGALFEGTSNDGGLFHRIRLLLHESKRELDRNG